MTDQANAADVFVLELDLDTVTLGELDLFEEHTGVAFEELGAILNPPTDDDGKLIGGPPKGRIKVMRALALIQLKRTNPAATWDDTYSIKLPSAREVAAGLADAPTVESGTDPLD